MTDDREPAGGEGILRVMLRDRSTGMWETVIRPYPAEEARRICAEMNALYADYFEFRVASPLSGVARGMLR